MKKIIILIAVLTCFGWSKCESYMQQNGLARTFACDFPETDFRESISFTMALNGDWATQTNTYRDGSYTIIQMNHDDNKRKLVFKFDKYGIEFGKSSSRFTEEDVKTEYLNFMSMYCE